MHVLFTLFFFILFAIPAWAQHEPVYQEEEQINSFKPAETDKIVCGSPNAPIRVTGFATNPPIGWVDQIGQQIYTINNGIGLAILEKLAADKNLKIENRGTKSYATAVRAVQTNLSDILLGAYYTPGTTAGLTLVYPSYASNPFIIVFKKGKEKPVKKWDDLTDLKGVVRMEEMVYPLIWRGLPEKVNLTQVNGARKAFEGILSGEYDYLFTSLYAAETEIRRFKLFDDVVTTDTPLTQLELFFAIGNNSRCMAIKDQLSDQIRELKKDPTAVQRLVIQQIDTWGKRFAKEPSLLEEMNGTAKPAH